MLRLFCQLSPACPGNSPCTAGAPSHHPRTRPCCALAAGLPPLVPSTDCTAIAVAVAGSVSQQIEAAANAVAKATTSLCSSGEAAAAASSSAEATAKAAAEAYASALAAVQSSPGCQACAIAEAAAEAVAIAIARACASSFTRAGNACCPNQAPAISSALVTALSKAIKTASVSGKARATPRWLVWGSATLPGPYCASPPQRSAAVASTACRRGCRLFVLLRRRSFFAAGQPACSRR